MLNKIGKKLGYKDGGFTIIEVMIVLAVAGLIMAIVLVAIPQLQRSQRNTARRDIANRIKIEVDSYSGNNTGKIPVASGSNTASSFGSVSGDRSFAGRYLDADSINDPQTGDPVVFNFTGAIPTTPEVGTVYYRTNQLCDGEVMTATGASGRSYAILMGLEGGSGYCVDNK